MESIANFTSFVAEIVSKVPCWGPNYQTDIHEQLKHHLRNEGKSIKK